MAQPSVDTMLAEAARRPLQAVEASRLGAAALDQRREEDALPAVHRAAERAPRDATLWHILGLLHRNIGDLTRAIGALDQALSVAPAHPLLVHARARAAADAGQPSLDWFRRARMLAPNDGDVILGEAAALLALGEHAAADATVADMLTVHPGWLAGHNALLRLRYAAQDAAWLGALDAAIVTAPADWRLHDLKLMALLRAGDYDRTRAALADARSACGPLPELRAREAVIATELGDNTAADDAFTRIDPLGAPDTALHWLRHLLRRGEPERVAALHDRLPPHSVANAWPYLSLAWRLLDDPRERWLDDSRLIKAVELGADWREFAALADTLRALHVTQAQPLDQSVRGGTQTDGPLLSRIDPVIAAVRARLMGAVREYIAALPPVDAAHPLLGRIPRHPRFVGSWSVRLTTGGFHAPHVHTQGWLSSAFYVALPPANSATHAGHLTLGAPQPGLGLELTPRHIVEPAVGRLILFPSTMWHGTMPFDTGERLTIAFDIG